MATNDWVVASRDLLDAALQAIEAGQTRNSIWPHQRIPVLRFSCTPTWMRGSSQPGRSPRCHGWRQHRVRLIAALRSTRWPRDAMSPCFKPRRSPPEEGHAPTKPLCTAPGCWQAAWPPMNSPSTITATSPWAKSLLRWRNSPTKPHWRRCDRTQQHPQTGL